MSNTSLLGSFGGLGDSSLMFRNVLINGCFRVWQRGTSQTSAGYGSDDRWNNFNIGSTKTHSQQAFTVGQTDIPGNPQFFSRTVVSSVAGAGNFVLKQQKIEDVRTLAGQTATLSFWAKADASKNMAVEFIQDFGTGGSPSASVLSIGVTTIALTTSWRYYTVTVAVPNISGKTLGTDNNHFFGAQFWFDAGSNINARTNSLGQQSGTFDIAQVQLEAGPTATPFERRPIGQEIQLCQRYYARGTSTTLNDIPFMMVGAFGNASVLQVMLQYPCPMRTVPTFARNGLHLANGVTGVAIASFIVNGANTTGAQLAFTAATASFGATQGGYVYSITPGHWFEINAEL